MSALDEIVPVRQFRERARGGHSLLPGVPLLDVATRTGFRYLANDPPRELVIGIDVAPDVFAAMNFLVTPDRSGSTLSTETRVYARTKGGKRSFAFYWFLIRPGSGPIRRMWLRAIRMRAEGGS